MPPSSRTRGLIPALLTVGIWTAFIVGSRALALRSLPPLDVALLRVVFAAVILVPWGWWRSRGRPEAWLGLSPLPWRQSAVLGLFGGLGYALVAYTAFQYAPASHGSVLMPGLLPLYTAVLSVWVLGEHIGRQRGLGLGLVLCGAAIMGANALQQAKAGSQAWIGDLMFMTASFCWANFAVLCRRWAVPAVDATIAVIVFSAVALVPAYAVLTLSGAVRPGLGHAPWSEILVQGVLQGWLSVVVAGVTFVKMLEHYGPIRTTMITATVPGLSAVSALLFLGEPLSLAVVAGLVCVTAGIYTGVRGAGRLTNPPPGAGSGAGSGA